MQSFWYHDELIIFFSFLLYCGTACHGMESRGMTWHGTEQIGAA